MHAANPEDHFEVDLSIYVNSEQVTIPADVGQTIQSLNNDGRISFPPPSADEPATLGEFFASWRSQSQPGSPSNITLTDTQLFDNRVNSHAWLQMFVNGTAVRDGYADFELHDEDDIVLVYGSNPVVTIVTNFEDVLSTVNDQPVRGRVLLELRPDAAPQTVDNFLNYVNDGDYNNAIFHRLVPGFVIQGGGFATPTEDLTSTAQFTSIPTDPPVQNEFQISNTVLTVGMAKLGGDPHSATNQFFVNTTDNSANLDTQNGGFTVFAHVLDPSLLNTITGFSRIRGGGAFTDLPYASGFQLAVIRSIEGDGVVGGVSFEDLNGNGIQDPGEAGLPGLTIYDDANGNHRFDEDEASTVTTDDGSYALRLTANQRHVIREYSSEGRYRQTNPSQMAQYSFTLEIGREVSRLDFANRSVAPTESPWQSPANQFDTSFDGEVAPNDVLLVINELNSRRYSDSDTSELPNIKPAGAHYIDANGDLLLTSGDALIVINRVNSLLAQGEGELSIEPPVAGVGHLPEVESGGDARAVPLLDFWHLNSTWGPVEDTVGRVDETPDSRSKNPTSLEDWVSLLAADQFGLVASGWSSAE